jgi:iron complex transport system permease protein
MTAPDLATRSRVWTVTLVSFVVFAAAAVLLPLLGSVPVDYGRAWARLDPDYQILATLRLPRVLLALLTGGALALSGVLFQALLRDALATPYTLGISSGASLGAVIAISAGFHAIWPSAVLAGMLTLVIVLGVAANRRILSPFTLLMAGITINSICMAAILFLHSVATFGQSIAITRWLMGGIEAVSMETLGWLTLAIVPGLLYCFGQARSWNVLAVGEEWAAIRGVPATRLLLSGYLVGSVLTGVVTSLTGPIGFVGLIIPHAVRMLFGADHRVLIPASFLIGGAFLAVCDTVARIALAPAEVPVGVITAMLGGPFFIWILRRR